MLISLVVPIFNQAGLIEPFFKAFRKFNATTPFPIELIVTNDGSKDRSLNVLTEYKKAFPNLKLVNHPENKGQGLAIVSALSAAKGDIALTLDLDMDDCLSKIPALIDVFLSANSEVVKVIRTSSAHTSVFRKSASFSFNALIRLFGVKSLVDIGSPIYIAKRRFYQKLILPAYASFYGVLPILIFKLAGNIPVTSLQDCSKSKGTSSYNLLRLLRFGISVIYHLARPLPQLSGSSFVQSASAVN